MLLDEVSVPPDVGLVALGFTSPRSHVRLNLKVQIVTILLSLSGHDFLHVSIETRIPVGGLLDLP